MSLTTLLLVVALVHVGSSAYSQITLQEKNAPLEKVLTAIEKQTKYVFLYDPEELKMVTISIDVKNASLRETLEKCFKGLPIEFTVRGNNVLLRKIIRKRIRFNDTKTFKINDHGAPGRTNL